MNKHKMGAVTILITVLILGAVFLLLFFTALNRDRPQITLPAESASSDISAPQKDPDQSNKITRVEITPGNVQAVIEALERPEQYTQSITLTTYWSGGSGTTLVQTAVDEGRMRIDTTMPGGQRRHLLRNAEQTSIWYNREKSVRTVPNGAFSPDEEQWVPTYEDILDWEPDRLLKADYQTCRNIDCIYVETRPDEQGDTEHYWVSVDTGLLVTAERRHGQNPVYRMEAAEGIVGAPEESLFILPGGEPFLTAPNQ